MNETNISRSRKKSPSPATPGNGEPVELKAGSVLAEKSAETHSRLLLAGMMAFSNGDFSVRLPTDWEGVDAQIAQAFNHSIAQKGRLSEEVARLSMTVGKEGRLKQRLSLPGAIGAWAAEVFSINTLIDDLVRPPTDIAPTIGAVAKGDLGQSMELEVDGSTLKGEFLRSATLWCGPRRKSRGPSAQWPRATSGSRWSWRWTGARSR